MKYHCCDSRRRELILAHPNLNGIDFLEVDDDPSQPDAQRQRTLLLHFLKPDNVAALGPGHIRLEGGDRIPAASLQVESVAAIALDSRQLAVRLSSPGDFAAYTLRLVASRESSEPPAGFDPLFAAVTFSFKVACPSDFDCRKTCECPEEPAPMLPGDYLAKDYASFRRLLLDRMAVLAPGWQERNAADLGITLVEILAYVADHLSYRQDAIATEAYLGTARRRVSVRRHARLVDYAMHEGCNARTWLHLQVRDVTRIHRVHPVTRTRTRFLTRCVETPQVPPGDLERVLEAHQPEVFELMHDLDVFPAHNELRLYTWSDRDCCLPKGAVRATLIDAEADADRLRLAPGDILVLEERLGPRTGLAADASPARRHAVRLTRVEPAATPTDAPDLRTPAPLLRDPLTGQAIVEIEWAADDALPFPFCVSATLSRGGRTEVLEDVSVARGNVALVDHGRTLDVPEVLRDGSRDTVPEPTLFTAAPTDGCHCETPARVPLPPRFHPRLQQAPLTFAGPNPAASPGPAAHALRADPALAQPEIRLESRLGIRTEAWEPRYDLLQSHAADPHVVVETEEDRVTRLRFGDDQHGKRPNAGTQFTAVYRVGTGTAGNVGAGAIHHVVAESDAIESVRNPLPATGGTEPETSEHARQTAPVAFQRQERAVTAADYAAMAERMPGLQKAAATFRWTGSWRTVFVAADRTGGKPVSAAFESQLRAHLDRYRMAGQDLEVEAPRRVPLEIHMHVCVLPGYFRSDVRAALLRIFSSRPLPDGRPGLFHPDNFSFGQPVHLSPLYAAARAVPGVGLVRITRFQRLGIDDPEPLASGRIRLNRLEIASLDNDASHADRGVFQLDVEGGQ